MVIFGDVTGEVQSFACCDQPSVPRNNSDDQGIPWRDIENQRPPLPGSRQHAFKSIWEQTLDPQGKQRSSNSKSSKPETWTIDWKKWPPHVPKLPKGLKIPVVEIPQVDLRLSLSTGRWDQITHGTTIVPVNYAKKKFFASIGGYLNIASSICFQVSPPSLLFLHAKAGQFYSVRLTIYNSGTMPRRLRVLSPANPAFTVVRNVDPKQAISPGCSLTLSVQYRPHTNDSVNDLLILHVEGDGALIVPLISACTPQPVLELEEWNCGCSTVGVPRTSLFHIKNVGGEGRFWILSEAEFMGEYLECHLKYKRWLIKESTKGLLRRRTLAILNGNIIGRGEASGFITRRRDSLDIDDEHDHENDNILGRENLKKPKTIKPRIYTKCFRIQPTAFRLQRNQQIEVKVRYHPKDANFHYEKLAIMCENGEVRWIAVKGLGIDRDSDQLVEIKAPWSGPPVDLPSDPRTKMVLDCGDLISGEIGELNFSVVNKSCIPLYFFWSIRPVLTDPEESPENTEIKLMERFHESTLYDQDGHSFFLDDARIDDDLESWISSLPLTIYPAQGLLEPKEELKIAFAAECPPRLGYHACIISLFVEQVDEESRHLVLKTLRELTDEKLKIPISHMQLSKELPPAEDEDDFDTKSKRRSHDIDTFDQFEKANVKTVPSIQDFPEPKEAGEEEENVHEEKGVIDLLAKVAEEDQEEQEYIPLQTSIQEYRTSIGGRGSKSEKDDPTLLPLVIAKRSSISKLSELRKSVRHSTDSAGNGKVSLVQDELNQTEPEQKRSNDMQIETDKTEQQKSSGDEDGNYNRWRRESIYVEYLPELSEIEHDRSMNEGHGVFEDLKNYTENVVPKYKCWPNRDKTLTPVGEVEIWMQSVSLDVTFTPPFVVAKGLVKTSIEKLVTMKNGTAHTLDMTLDNITDPSVAITCHPKAFSVKAGQKFTFKLSIHFEKCCELDMMLHGNICFPFTKVPCTIPTLIKAYGPFLQILTPTLNFGIVPLASETMKTLAFKNSTNRPIKWIARMSPDGMEDENSRAISGHQSRIFNKRLVRLWPEWGVLEPGESAGLQVYFCAELTGEIASYVEVMVENNPASLATIPVYGEIELPFLVLERGRIEFNADSFMQQSAQTASAVIANPSGFNVGFLWQCPVGKQCNSCTVLIHPMNGIVPAKGKLEVSFTVESHLRDEPLELNNLFVSCCVEGMQEPLILKIDSIY